jgi:mannosyltransferase
MKVNCGLMTHWPVLIAVLLGTALRFYGLGSENLWLDEALSWQQAVLPAAELIQNVAADVHPPLYALMLHAVTTVLGDSEWALRLPSAICGALSVWLTWLVCRRLASDRAALLASLICAVSLFNIQYAQEARMYTLMGCLALISMLLLLQISAATSTRQHGSSRALQFSYLLATCLLIYSHVYGLFIVLAQNLFMGARYLPGWPDKPTLALSGWIKLQLLLGLLFAPWVVVLVAQISRVQASFWLHKPYFNALRETFVAYMGSMPALQLAMLAVAIGLVTLLLPAGRAPWLQDISGGADKTQTSTDTRSLSRQSVALLLALWLLTPIFLPYLISQFGQSIFLPRYTIASSFAWFMLVAIGINSLPANWLRYSAAALLLAVMAGTLPFYYANSSRTDWPAAVAYLEERAAPSSLLLFHSDETIAPYRYYSERDDLALETVIAAGARTSTQIAAADKPDVRPVARDYQQVWLVSGYDYKTIIGETEILGQLVDTHESLGGQEFGAIRVFQFDRAAP